MYNDELRALTVPITDLFLDPNNPRFWDEKPGTTVPIHRILDAKVQEEAERRISGFGIEELKYNILRNGFLPLDRIAVKQIEGFPGKYVVLEGNRRLAALRSLHRDIDERKIVEESLTEAYLDKLRNSTSTIEVLEYIGASDEDITWILQGIRHISGVKEWEPAQRAKLVVTMRAEGKPFKEIGQKFGISAQAVGRLYRSFRGLDQMRNDDEFGSRARSDYFSLFEEAYRNMVVRQWLGWDEESAEFKNTANLQQFYSWITPDEEHGKERRIHDPKHIAKLGVLLQADRLDLLTQVDQHELSIEDAYARATAVPATPEDPSKTLSAAISAIKRMPAESFLEHTQAVHSLLTDLKGHVEKLLNMLERVEASA